MSAIRLKTVVSKLWVGALALFAISPAVGGPREDVAGVASVIEEHYFDAKRAKEIAEDLRKAAANGDFDRLTERNDLVVAVTERLRPIDRHFSVAWRPRTGNPPDAAPAKVNAPRPMMDFDALNARTNYGFRRIERLAGNLAYIELTSVAHIDFKDPNSKARRAADSALEMARTADAIVLDLRNNGGGAPSMVGYLVSAFVKADADVYNTFHARDGTESERPDVLYPQPMLDIPLYVLTSARTGSAAESIAFTLQSCGRAAIVGERSGGAANPGGMFQTREGLDVFVSTGSPRNPINGRNWEGDGVKPDVEAVYSAALVTAQTAALQKSLGTLQDDMAKEEVRRVLETLQAKATPYRPSSLNDYVGSYTPYQVVAENDTLKLRAGRREPRVLIPLKADVFFNEYDPEFRFIFERKQGRVVALSIQTPQGGPGRFSKTSD